MQFKTSETLNVGAIEFLSAFYDLKYETMFFRLLDDPKSGDAFKQNFESDGDNLRATLNFLYHENKKGRGVFFVVNGGGHADANVRHVKAQFVDLDSGTKAEQLKRIEEFDLPPSLVVETGKGHHAYWLMRGAKLELFESIQKRLVKQFDGDPVCVNLSRIMRLPQFYHNKKEPIEMRCVKFDPHLVYTQAELESVLPNIDEHKRKVLDISGIVSEGSRNDVLFKLACKLQGSGMPDDVILSTISSVNQERVRPPLDERELETLFKQAVKKYPKGEFVSNTSTPFIDLEREKTRDGKDGAILRSIENFLRVLRIDPYFANVRFNLLSHNPEKLVDGVTVRWNDADDASAKHHIEKFYKFHHDAKFQDALRIFFAEREYHPVKDIIESLEWDGKSRILDFLHTWTGCENNPYTREVSRLIFAGGIHRIYNAGCKFDDVPVLIGTKQGEGKSTLVRWLALKDEFFGEVSEIEGQKGIEALEGLWICEIAEMLATTKAKEVEAVKAYITRQSDRYRRPFERRTSEHARQCIFIGTTNKQQFLTDKTGNRRFYPVEVNQTGYDLFDKKAEIKAYIKQCWAEALQMFRDGELKPYADRGLKDLILAKQNNAVEEDWRVEAIRDYLEENNCKEICVLELWFNALKSSEFSKPTRKDSNEISLIMQSLGDWKRMEKPKKRPNGYEGLHKYWALEEEQAELLN